MLDVYYNDVWLEDLKNTFPKREIIFHKTDVTEDTDIQRAFIEITARFKTIDIIVTCSGIIDEHDIEEMIHVNLVNIFFILNIKR